jgi:hypothetical protein
MSPPILTSLVVFAVSRLSVTVLRREPPTMTFMFSLSGLAWYVWSPLILLGFGAYL